MPIAYTSGTPDPARFLFSTGETIFSLVYMPSQTVWLSRQGSIRELPAGYQKQNNIYTSPNFESAANQVEIKVDQAIGNLVIRPPQ